VSKTSIYDWMRYYTVSGKDLRALVPDLQTQEGKRKSKLQPEVATVLNQVIREKCLAKEATTINQIRAAVALRLYELNQNRYDDEQLSLPARSTIAKHIQALDVVEVFRAKNGAMATRRKFRQYGQREKPQLPGERTETDHTRLDLIVVDDADDLPLGRLTVTWLLDGATEYPFGYSLGWDGPGYLAVAACLYHAICPKIGAKEKYDLAHEWLAYGIPSVLVTDNGREFTGKDLRDAAQLLGIVLQRTPVKNPHYKGGIERFIGTMNTMGLHGLPGTTFSNIGKRNNYESEREAAVYLSEVDKLMHIYSVDVYAESYHSGIRGIPARRYEYALDQGFIPRLPPSLEELRILLGRTTERALHHYGIEFESLLYNCAELGPLRAAMMSRSAILKRNAGTEKASGLVKVKYDPGDLGAIHVYDPFDQRYFYVPALSEYAHGLSLWKHRVIMRVARTMRDKVDEVALGLAYRKIQEVVQAGRDRRSMAARSRIARWSYGGKSTKDIQFPSKAGPQASLTITDVTGEPTPAPMLDEWDGSSETLALPEPNRLWLTDQATQGEPVDYNSIYENENDNDNDEADYMPGSTEDQSGWGVKFNALPKSYSDN
ncbi:MAG: Mu transposase C-terminal domain-containing protein, partial [Chloroflexota bacterium]|nr:Mu transposase C-terminal domain-containing protein [Chloroflexota bacterium]